MFTGIKMVLVFALLGGTLYYLRRHDRSSLITARRTERPVAVLAQAKVGKTASVALVRIGTEAYAVGVTEQAVSLLVAQPIALPELDAPGPSEDGDEAEDGTVATAAPVAARTTGRRRGRPTGGAADVSLFGAVRGLLGRRRHVEYLDVELPPEVLAARELPRPRAATPRPTPVRPAVTPAPATDGTVRSPSARTPEPAPRR